MGGFFFEQKQTERAAGNRSPNCLFGLPHSGRIWLRETLGPHFPACPAARLSALLSLPLPLSDLRNARETADVRGRDRAESREVLELAWSPRHCGKRCWKEAVAGLHQPRLTLSTLLAAGGLGWGWKIDSFTPSIHFVSLPAQAVLTDTSLRCQEAGLSLSVLP